MAAPPVELNSIPYSKPESEYRKDIDGLRAVAVLLVVLFHAGVTEFPGGFIGVDVFFVISGFLITQILVQSMDRGTFTFSRFYARRIRRLLPAYSAMLLVIVIAGLWISLPKELVDLGQSIFSSGLYATNMLFWRESGYFAGSAEIKPLLHTWSLSVEEQFYLLFPAMLLILRKIGASSFRLHMISMLLILSIIASEALLSTDPSASFYLLPSRGWELMLGAALAVSRRNTLCTRSLDEVAVALGLALILGSAAWIVSGDSFPGVRAIPPCAGAALVIRFGAKSRLAEKVLGNSPMVLIGKISYSLYLWHWPALAFARYTFVHELPPSIVASVLILSFILAYLSYRYIETPFRSVALFPRFPSFVAALVLSAASLALGAALVLGKGMPGRLSKDELQLLEPVRGNRYSGCMASPGHWIDPKTACTIPANAMIGNVAVWGDSHAHAVLDEISSVAREHRSGVRFFGYTACPPVPGIRPANEGSSNRCAQFNSAVKRQIIGDKDIHVVVLVARHAVYLYGFADEFGPAEASGGHWFKTDDGKRVLAGTYFQEMDALVSELVGAGKTVVLFHPVPEVAYDVPTTLILLKRRGVEPASFSRPIEMYRARQGEIRLHIDQIARRYGLETIDPGQAICGEVSCAVMQSGAILYADDNHLSKAGTTLLRKDIERAIFDGH